MYPLPIAEHQNFKTKQNTTQSGISGISTPRAFPLKNREKPWGRGWYQHTHCKLTSKFMGAQLAEFKLSCIFPLPNLDSYCI